MAGAPPGPAFDADHPPASSVLGDCVHCGFCLPSCPTYVLWGEEMDSPRGRIDIMAAGAGGEPMTASMVRHVDACLGCMACVTACPSGVRYDQLIETTRAQVERRWRRGWRERALRAAIFATFPHPRRLGALAAPLRAWQRSGLSGRLRRSGLLARVSPTLAAMEALAPPVAGRRPAVPGRTPATGPRRGTVGLLLGCVQRELFPEVNAATVRVLAAEGFDVVVPPGQGCCGALSVHAGRAAEGRDRARRLVQAFAAAGVDHVVVNAAGCGSTMKTYGDLLDGDPAAASFAGRVRDVAELLAEVGPVAPRHPVPAVAAYHDACHLAHAQGVRAQPRALLAGVPGLELREIAEGELCCGSAGIYNLLQPGPAAELGDRKAANVAATGAELLVTANPGCAMQIAAALARRGRAVRLAHTVEVLDASIRGVALGSPTPPATGR
ncbi:MAG TPA: heterodisulfide reductase-related iron-sulfur binding cluster [Acidimicrobiales bacterium]|nr:heterodisulfide reductase-related iron-sulfur binding cluster [Acidimicrobiales bacterium]